MLQGQLFLVQKHIRERPVTIQSPGNTFLHSLLSRTEYQQGCKSVIGTNWLCNRILILLRTHVVILLAATVPKERNLQKTKTTPKDSFDAEIAEGAAYKQSEEAMNHKTFADTCKTFADTLGRKGDCQLQCIRIAYASLCITRVHKLQCLCHMCHPLRAWMAQPLRCFRHSWWLNSPTWRCSLRVDH